MYANFYFMSSLRPKPLLNIAEELANEILSLRRELCFLWEFQMSSPVNNLHGITNHLFDKNIQMRCQQEIPN